MSPSGAGGFVRWFVGLGEGEFQLRQVAVQRERSLCFQRAETAGRLRRRDCRKAPFALVQRNHRLDVDIGDAVAIGEAEGLVVADIGENGA